MKSNAITTLIKKVHLPGVPVILTEYLTTVPLQLLSPGEQVNQGNIPKTWTYWSNGCWSRALCGHSWPGGCKPTTSNHGHRAFGRAKWNSYRSSYPTIPPTQITESVEGDSAKAAPHKEIHPSTTALPSAKRRRLETKASVEFSLPSSNETLIDFSEADWAALIKAISEPLSQTEKGKLTEATSSPTILRSGPLVEGSLMNQESSQTSREGSDPNAQSKGSLPNSPDGTYLDPAGTGSDVGADRQLGDNDSISFEELPEENSSQTLEGVSGTLLSIEPDSIPTEIQTRELVKDKSSQDDQQLGFTKDGDLRNPIAPPVTFLKLAMVNFLAGTFGCWNSER